MWHINSWTWKTQAFIKLHESEIQALISLLEKTPPDDNRLTIRDYSDDSLVDRLKLGLSAISAKSRPTVFDRLNDVECGQSAYGDNIPLDNVTEFSYSWSDHNNTGAGYEKLDSKRANNGGLSYCGVYHPNSICEGGGICIHCGRTL